MTRCPLCNKKNLSHCKGSVRSCDCKCTKFVDNKKPMEEPERISSPEGDDFINDINERFRNR